MGSLKEREVRKYSDRGNFDCYQYGLGMLSYFQTPSVNLSNAQASESKTLKLHDAPST
jgi:hypothetical protein